MPPLLRVSAVFLLAVAVAVALALAPTAVADPVDPIPGNGVFVVGPDIAPGLYHTGGPGSTFGVWINNVPTQDSMCSWFTYSTPDGAKDHVLQTNTSVGSMFANINTGWSSTLEGGDHPSLVFCGDRRVPAVAEGQSHDALIANPLGAEHRDLTWLELVRTSMRI